MNRESAIKLNSPSSDSIVNKPNIPTSERGAVQPRQIDQAVKFIKTLPIIEPPAHRIPQFSPRTRFGDRASREN